MAMLISALATCATISMEVSPLPTAPMLAPSTTPMMAPMMPPGMASTK